ncbi:mitochondrial carrier protein, putative [Plasmodium vivax]|uniref:Mitochondrial carrier protein, putative n=1 Tax=Plasmodium vivax TaxID=5855 RepID=A0A564ZNZ3_PLAVI|nr:mitochondrial carrier protein, putative [Plasmodium vivax]
MGDAKEVEAEAKWNPRNGQEPSMLRTLYGSIIASTLSRVVLYPLDTVKINKQVDTSSSQLGGAARSAGPSTPLKTPRSFFFLPAFIKTFGYRGLYRGFVFSAMTTIPATSLYFCCFEYLKRIKMNWNNSMRDAETGPGQKTKSLSFANYFTIAFLAEAMSCVLFVPIDVIKERLQAQRYLQLKEYRTSYHLVKDLIRREGFFRLYRGYVSTCLTYGMFGGSFFFLQNMGLDLMRRLEIEPSNLNSLKLNLLCSMLSGIITSPLEVVRIRYQLQEKNRTPFFYSSSVDGIKKLWGEGSGKIFNLFKGNLYRCFLVCLSMTMNVTIIDLYKQFA